MSKVSFDVNGFRRSVSILCSEKSARAENAAEFLAGSISTALESTLIDGSDAINQALTIIKNSGKNGFAPRFRKVINKADYSALSAYGVISEFAFIKAKDFIGGNSQKCKNHEQRRETCASIHAALKAKGLEVFAPKAVDVDADPIATIGRFNAEKIGELLAKANADQLESAEKRLSDLLRHVSTALNTIREADKAAAAAAAAADTAAATEAAKPQKANKRKAAAAAAADTAAATEAAKPQKANKRKAA